MLFKVGCEAGTYIRKLCFDIGEVVGVGAHMQELRRTRAGPFVESSSTKVTLHDVQYYFNEWEEKKDQKVLHKFIQPMETALALLPKVTIRDSAVDAICHGANLTAPGVLSLETGIQKDSIISVFTLKGEAVALAKSLVSSEEMQNLKHGAVAASQRVLMQRGTYPKVWKSDKANE